jgi:molybdopterin-guanine dinucleotide biosynthesis protein A
MGIRRVDIAGLILIGGKSERMGQPKALIELAREPLWLHSCKLLRPFVNEVFLVGSIPGFEPPASIRLLTDSPPGFGPLGGIATGLERSGYPHHLLVAVDYPLIRPDLLTGLLAHSESHWAVCTRSAAFLEPLVAYYRTDCAPVARQMLAAGEVRTHRLFERVPSFVMDDRELAKIDPPKWSHFNVNTPSDLLEAEARLGSGYPT